jgi:hypothetical protein
VFRAPFATTRYTVSISVPEASAVKRVGFGPAGGDGPHVLKEVAGPLKLASGTWCRDKGAVVACLDLPKGKSALETS